LNKDQNTIFHNCGTFNYDKTAAKNITNQNECQLMMIGNATYDASNRTGSNDNNW